MKAAEQYFPVVLFTMLYKVVLISESVPKILKWDIKAGKHNFLVALFIMLYIVQGDIKFEDENRKYLFVVLSYIRTPFTIGFLEGTKKTHHTKCLSTN